MKLLVHFRFLSLLCTLLVLTATEISALDIQWSGYQAKAPSAPTVSEISLPNQTRGARIEASSDGAYQGAVGTLAKPVNLEDFRLIEFSIRHNITSGKISFSIMLFCKPGMVHGRFTVPTSQWNQVSIPLDVSSFSGRRDTSVIFGELSSIRITPFDAMDTAGKFLEIADFRLLPKVDEKAAMPIKVMNYFHNNPPSSGEKDNTVLTDGDLTENVHFRQYTENPDIVFDLGGRFTIDEIVVSSNAAPSHNYSELTICSSYDGKEWRPSGAIKNEAEGTQARIVKNKYVGDDRKMIGRYFRIQAARPRSDFSVYLSEISFFGHPPTPDEIAKAAESNYDTGAPMPLRTVEHYVELKKNDLQLWISRKNGVINGVFCGGRLIVERLTPQYTLQSRTKDTVVFGNKDVVQSIHAEDSQVTVITSNPGLPGLEVRRTWQVQGNALIEKVTLVNQSMKERMFLRMATEVILAQSFRNHGFYEMPASALAAEMFRMSASEVLMDRAMTNIPTIAFENDKERLTLWHTRYRFNDQFTYMDLGTEEDNLQVFRANGWLLTAATFVPADGKEQSYETRFAFTSGRLLKAFEEYQALPEVSAFRSQIKRPAWLRDIRAIISFGWDGTYPGSMQRLMKNYAGAFSHRGTLYEPTLYDLDGIWGDLLTQGEIRGWFGNRQTPEELQEKIKMFRASDPRFKVGYYTWFWSAFPWSTPVKNHPEWFVKKLRNGANASWFPGVNVNYLRFWGIKESRDEAAKQVIRAVDFYEQDGWYLDGGKSGVYAKDWETMRIDDPLGQTAFYDTVRKGIQKGNPNRVVFFNHSENPLGDLGFLESFGGTLTTDWRRGAVLMWKFKLYSYRDPLRYGVYIYWLPQVDHAFKNYLVGIGVMPSYLSRHFKAEDLPYIAARYEIRQAQITEAGVTPDWRFDEKETLECMALNQGTNGWLYMQYHGEEKAEKKVSVEIAPLGLTDSGKPIYAWLYHIKDAQKFHSKLSEPQIAKAYRETGWIADRAVSVQYLGKFPYAEQFSQQIEFAPGEGKVLMLTQLPAVVMSIEDEPSHYRLSGQPGITVEAASDMIVVNNEYNSAEIGLLLPEGKVPSAVQLNGQAVQARICCDGGLPMAVVLVGKGESRIQLSLRPGEIPVASTLDVQLTERRLVVSVTPQDAVVEIRHAGCMVLSKVGSFQLELPDTAVDGEYEIISGKLCRKITLQGMSKPFQLLPLLKPLPSKTYSTPVNRTIRNIKVLTAGTDISEGAGTAAAEAEQLRLFAGSIRHYESHFNRASAAFEIKAKRYLKVRLINGFQYHNLYGFQPGRNAVRPGIQNFGGLVLDFETAAGEWQRIAAGFGLQSEKRTSTLPDQWGKKARPDGIYLLNQALLDKEFAQKECWIDLNSLGAPSGWNGRMWLTLHFENITPDRTFTLELLETSDVLPVGSTAEPVQRLDVELSTKILNIMQVPTKPADWSAIPVLGTLTPFEISMAPVKTEVRAAYDSQNLYLHWDCEEPPGRLLDCEGGRGGKPWQGDGTEFFVELGGQADTVLHGIVDAEGHVYVEQAPLARTPGKPVAVLAVVPFTFIVQPHASGWRTEVTVPWSALGGKPSPEELRAFNMMRTRLEQGQYGLYTLAPGKKYFSERQYRFQLEK